MDSFLNCVVSNMALAGALALATCGLQRFRRSPQLAHVLWLLVLVKLVTPPVFHVALPGRFVLSAMPAAPRGSSGDAGHWRTSTDAEQSSATPTFSPRAASLDGNSLQATVDLPAEPARIKSTSPRAPWGKWAVSSLPAQLATRWQLWVCAVWAGGAIFGAVILWRRHGRFRTLLIEAVDADVALVDDMQAIAKRLGIRNCPSVRVLDAHVPPLVYAGWRSPLLLVPARLLKELDREQLHSVLVHELAHIRRGDHLVRWFDIFVRGLFWWNPLAWWASRQLRQAAEECCDAWVVWVLPGGQRSYSQALMWTIEFLAERRVIPIVAGTAFGGSHLKRRIEMIMTHKLNRRMSRRAIIAVVVLGACVLPVAAQKPRDEPSSTVQESTSNPAPVAGAPVGRSQPAADNRSLEARIEQLERLVHELSQTVKHSAADASTPGRINHGDPAVASKIDVISGKWTSGRIPHFPSPAPENEEDRQLKEILVALSKQSWEAAGRRDWIVYEKLLAEDYHGFYVNSSGSGRVDKATTIAAVKRRRYFDLSMQDVEARRIGNDTAIFTYIYSCKVEEAGQLQTYRDHQATQVWTRKTDAWVLSFAQEFVLPGGE